MPRQDCGMPVPAVIGSGSTVGNVPNRSLLVAEIGAQVDSETGSAAPRRSSKPERLSPDEIRWRQYALYVDLYKFYFEIAIKYNVFYYGITGGLLSYYFSHPTGPVKYALALPLVLSLGAGLVLVFGAQSLSIMRDDLFSLRDKLRLDTAPDFSVLARALYVFGIAQFLTMFGLAFVLWKCPKGL